MEGRGACRLRTRCFEHGLRVRCGDAEQDSRGTVWLPPALLPALQRTGAHAEQRREVLLGETELGSHSQRFVGLVPGLQFGHPLSRPAEIRWVDLTAREATFPI